MKYHTPVLLSESVDGLNVKPDGVYVDVTFGGGGHSREILSRLGKKGKLIAFDQDPDAGANTIDDARFVLVGHNFRFIKNFLRFLEVPGIDGLLADLGVSSHHFDTATRGFSFQQDGPLDMRMNTAWAGTAADVVNNYSIDELTRVFRVYGEVDNAYKLAKVIEGARRQSSIHTTSGFIAAIQPCLPLHQEYKYLAKVFQALRVEVNMEFRALGDLLLALPSVINPGGRLAVISYHSIEDRLVKNFIKAGNLEGVVEKDFFGKTNPPFRAVNRKIIVPGEEEMTENSRARSAKLRVAQKV